MTSDTSHELNLDVQTTLGFRFRMSVRVRVRVRVQNTHNSSPCRQCKEKRNERRIIKHAKLYRVSIQVAGMTNPPPENTRDRVSHRAEPSTPIPEPIPNPNPNQGNAPNRHPNPNPTQNGNSRYTTLTDVEAVQEGLWLCVEVYNSDCHPIW